MLKRLYVHNFRCLENFELPISEKPSSLLVGRNGTGKSTVARALEILQSIARGTNRVGSLLTRSDFARSRSDVPIRFEIEASLCGRIYQYNLAFELPEGFKELRVAEERFSVDGRDICFRDRSQVTLARTTADREARFLVDWHLVALPVIQEHSESDPLHIFKNWLARTLILAPIPSQITGESTGDTLMPNRSVTNFGEWFSGLLAHSPSAYTHIDKYLKGVMPDLIDIKNPVSGGDSRSLTIQFRQDAATLNVPFSDLSDGEKCFFICAVVLAANQAYGPLLCFWDEPDNYLHLSEVGHFVMDLRRSFQAGGQFLATSHNSEAIRHFSEENTLLLHRRSHLDPTIVRPISDLGLTGNLVDALIRDDVEA